MNFNEYQAKCYKTAIYPNLGDNIIYPAICLAGEAGEVANKIGHWIRDRGYFQGKDVKPNQYMKNELVKEMGDVMWEIAMLAYELNINLDDVAKMNIEKLDSRKRRGKVSGSGDNR